MVWGLERVFRCRHSGRVNGNEAGPSFPFFFVMCLEAFGLSSHILYNLLPIRLERLQCAASEAKKETSFIQTSFIFT